MDNTNNYWDKEGRVKPVTIKTCTGDHGSYELPDKNIFNKRAVRGIAVRPVENRKKLTENGLNLVNEDVFYASFLSLRDSVSTEILTKIPLELLVFNSNSKERYYRIEPLVIDVANSKIICKNIAALADDEEYELYFLFE